MKLPPRFVLVIDGDLSRVNSRAVIVPDSLPYLLDRLLRGNEVSGEAFRSFGLRLIVEPDTDGGDEIPVDR